MTRRWIPLLIVGLSWGSFAGCDNGSDGSDVAELPAAPTTILVERGIRYFDVYEGRGGEPTMFRFTPGDGANWPIVVLLHGGRQTGGSMEGAARALAERGLLVYAPTYNIDLWRVGSEMVESGQWAGEVLLGDLACAIRAARHDAATQGGDTDRLVLAGYSMGAAFGATVAIVGDDPELTTRASGGCVVQEGSAVPSAFYGWEGPYDWDEIAEGVFPRLVELAPDAIRALGPLPHVATRSPDGLIPFHLQSGDQLYRSVSHADHLRAFESALTAAGWPVWSEILPGRVHTDFMTSPGIPESYDLIAQIANDPTAR